MKYKIAIHGETARLLGERGELVFGPGPRKWTFLCGDKAVTWHVDTVTQTETGPVWTLWVER